MTALGERCENGFSDAGSIPAAFTSVTLDPIRFGFGVLFCPFFLPQTAAKRFRLGASGSQKPFVAQRTGRFPGLCRGRLEKVVDIVRKIGYTDGGNGIRKQAFACESGCVEQSRFFFVFVVFDATERFRLTFFGDMAYTASR